MSRHYWPQTFSVYHWCPVERRPIAAAVAWSARSTSFLSRTTQVAQSLVWRLQDGSLRMDSFVKPSRDLYAFWTEQLDYGSRRLSIIDRIARKRCTSEPQVIPPGHAIAQPALVRYHFHRASPALTYFLDEQLQFPLTGEARYEGGSKKWETVALAESALGGRMAEVREFHDSLKILPLQTTGREGLLQAARDDASIQELLAAFHLPDPTSPWLTP